MIASSFHKIIHDNIVFYILEENRHAVRHLAHDSLGIMAFSEYTVKGGELIKSRSFGGFGEIIGQVCHHIPEMKRFMDDVVDAEFWVDMYLFGLDGSE